MRTRNGKVMPLVSRTSERPLVEQFFGIDEALHAQHLNFQKEGPPTWDYPIKHGLIMQVRDIEPLGRCESACETITNPELSTALFTTNKKEVEERFSRKGHTTLTDMTYYEDNSRLCQEDLVFCVTFDVLDFLFGDPI